MKKEKYMCPFYDASFKRIFGQTENKMLLIDFLNNLLDGERHIIDVTYLDKEQVPQIEGVRVIIYDVYCKTDTGEYFIVEMQNWSQEHFLQRTLYYASTAIVKQRTKIEEERKKREEGGGWNYDVKAVYTIAFLNYTDDSIDRRSRVDAALCDMKTGRPLTHLMRFVYLQLPLFKKKQDECNTFFERWIYVLKNMDVLDKLPDAYQCDAFNKLKEVADLSKLDGESLAEYERTRRDYWDTQMMFQEKTQQGIEIGHKEGLEEGRRLERAKADAEMRESKVQTVRSLKANGVPIHVIQQAVGLTEEEINAL